jgi:phytoene desaturase
MDRLERRMNELLVIGGGFAGLSAAIYASLGGAKVTLLEKGDKLGGKAGVVESSGFRFDTGPSVFTLPEVLNDIFAAAGKALPIKLRPVDPVCRYHFPSDRVWDVSLDAERTAAGLPPEQAHTYLRLLRRAQVMYEQAAPTFVYGSPPDLKALAKFSLRYGWRSNAGQSLFSFLEKQGATGELRDFFLRFATYFGADPFKAPAILHNIAWAELGLGVTSPEGGIHGVIRALTALAQEVGVAVQVGCDVEGLDVRHGRVVEVKSTGGSYFPSAVISTLDVIRTHRLLGIRHDSENQTPSLSGVVVLLGVEGDHTALAQHNIFFPQNYQAEFKAISDGDYPEDPTLYLHIGCRTTPTDAPPGHENWFVMANAPPLGPDEKIDLDAEQAFGARVVSMLLQKGVLTEGQVKMCKVLGPSHLKSFGHRGSIYGRAPHSLLTTLRPHQRIRGLKNILLAGGTVHPGGGMPLAMLSGKRAAEGILATL